MSQTLDCQYEIEMKRQSIEWKHYEYPVNKKFQSTAISWESHTEIFIGHQRIHLYRFPWKKAKL